ncbi:hypothetical protein BGZ76_007375, partial [Entomortierella beljakovae]
MASSTSTTPPRATKIPQPSEMPPAKRRKYSATNSIDQPWRSLLHLMLQKIKGGDVACQEEWPQTLNGIHLSLYKFIKTKLHHPLPLTKISEKDMFVVMSGIVNTRMDGARGVFGDETVDKVRELCLKPYICNPSQQLLDVLAPLKEAYRSGSLDELLFTTEEGLGIVAKERREKKSHSQLKGRIMDAVRH